ncbi:hypothetical protein LQ327_13985 [Actinomycetospora endophytica]|uniref:Uncharacterized protein n=1 Tax=Actinomycetospora endophytica TaxID=2291215 RepID=A0ABS8PAD3_9PSEU|nr:hypothetical protein [Actinomycetospora endophytica]MCD2194480.1 hypothetical protein [Actinomycetospora endophytica]
MIHKIGTWVRNSASGAITDASFDGFSMSIIAGNWGFSTTIPWRIVSDGDLIAASADLEPAQEALKAILGTTLADVVPMGRLMLGDPALVPSSGSAIEVFSDTQIDPWALSTPT